VRLTHLLALAALGCAPVDGTVSPADPAPDTDAPDDEQPVDDPFTWTGQYLATALDRIVLRGEREQTEPACVQIVLVSPGFDGGPWNVDVTPTWGVEHAWTQADACPDEPIWPDGADPARAMVGEIRLEGERMPPVVELDLVLTPADGPDLPLQASVDVAW